MRDALLGALVGTIVGDALGLPYEGLDPRRARRLLGKPDRHRFLRDRGMVSDDSEHAVMVARALARSAGEPAQFAAHLARELRYWFATLPLAVGWGTLRACVRLWFGVPPERSGVWSAGNGAAMRAPLLGVAARDEAHLLELVRASTLITHRDPRAHRAALAVALAARIASRQPKDHSAQFLRAILPHLDGDELAARLLAAAASARAGEPTPRFALHLGMRAGVSGHCHDTVPVCIQAWLAQPRDFARAVTAVIECGGDADTTAAITGGIVGAGVGRENIPSRWRERLWDGAWSWQDVERLAGAVERATRSGTPQDPGPARLLARLPRSAIFASIVFVHVVRRLLPRFG